MFDAATGEIGFDDYFLKPHHSRKDIGFANLYTIQAKKDNPSQGLLTLYPPKVSNEYGQFAIQLTFEPEEHLVMVTACHQNEFYETKAPRDSERRTYHDSIIAKDLAGQREFSWGEVRSIFCEVTHIDFLAVIYTPGSNMASPTIPDPDSMMALAMPENEIK